jgi:hypothetical protein
MTYWGWATGGLALAGVMLLHWMVTRRVMAVSGRYSALVDRVRLGTTDDDPEMDLATLVAAAQAATVAEFGPEGRRPDSAEAGAAGDTAAPAAGAAPEARPRPQRISDHVVFVVCLALGGLISALLGGRFHFTPGLAGAGFSRITHGSPVAGAAALLVGGALVGFGTRMAGGCTSGHGMNGVSTFQKGSLLATVAFFGTGVVAAFALGWLR